MTTRDTAAEPRTAGVRREVRVARAWQRVQGMEQPPGRDFVQRLIEGMEREGLAIEAEAASGPALTTADVARALIESDLIPRYMEYARLAPSMNPAETIEHVAATWAPFVLARLAPAAAEPSVYMGCHIGWPHEHEAPAAAEPAEAPTIRDLIGWVEDEGHNANAADEIQIWYRAYLAAHPGPSE